MNNLVFNSNLYEAHGFTGSRELCELWKNVKLKKLHKAREPNLCEPNLVHIS